MKNLIRIGLLLLFPALTFAQNELEKITLFENKLKILVPKSFHRMTEEEYKLKYPNPKRKPSLIMTDKDLEANLVIDYLQQYPLNDDQVAQFKDMQLAAVQNAHPEGKLFENDLSIKEGKKMGIFKIMTDAIDQKVFNYFIFTDLNGKVLMLTFNCPEKLMPEYSPVIDKMVASMELSN